MPVHENVEQAYIGYIKAESLLRLIANLSDDGEHISINKSVFFDNVRDYNPNSAINKRIIEEIENGDRKAFVFRNNGVTVIAKKVHRTGDKFRIEGYQIVNGCQTSNVIFHCRNMIEDIEIPFRLIESKSEDFVTSIIVGTNNQNVIKEEQFWALRPFLKNLEEYSRGQSGDFKLFVERRENQYRNEDVERTRVIKTSELMKVVAAMYLHQPHRAARDFRGIRNEYDGKVFQEGHDIVPYHLACYASYKFEFCIRNNRIDRSKKYLNTISCFR